ncbi:TPA: hypothetical protein ACT5CK_002402, partial [Flavobacterium psychrophilum]
SLKTKQLKTITMNLSKKILSSILMASVTVTVIQCGKEKKIIKNKPNKATIVKDSIDVDTLDYYCPPCGKG